MEIPLRVRYAIRDHDLLIKLMQNPGRGTPYSTRTLAEAVGCHHSLVHRLITGQQETVDMELAHDVAEAVGVAVLVLFDPPASPNPTDSATE